MTTPQARHQQWTTVAARNAIVGRRIICQPLVEFDDDGDGVAFYHPDPGGDWTATIIRVGAHAGDGQYHCLVEFRSVPAAEPIEV